MPKHNRNTLKSFFSDGAMPSSDMFEDLIDSTINLDDDGYEKTAEDGVKISTIGNHKNLVSWYDMADRDNAQWSLRFDGQDSNLVFGRATRDPNDDTITPEEEKINNAFCLDKSDGCLKVGIGHNLPKDTLDVNGTIRSSGRRGTFGYSFKTEPIKEQSGARKKWRNITPVLTGGVILEVVARAKNDEKKYYGLMHAIAMHSPWRAKRDLLFFLNFKTKIRYTYAVYESLRHRIKLRWHRQKGEKGYRLQISSCCEYGDNGVLDFHITSLWSDEDTFYSEAEEDQENQENIP